jgi:hypothetical protein
VAWSADSKHCFFADRFGDVFAAAVAPAGGSERPAHLLLGHLQAIITSLTPSADGSMLISTDRDAKVRASILPADPCKVSAGGFRPRGA